MFFPVIIQKKVRKNFKTKYLTLQKNIIFKNTLDDFKEYPKKISDILSGSKGDYMVMAGVYNTFGFETASLIAKAISKDKKCETMVMAYDCISQRIDCMVYSNGESKSNNPIWAYED
jgi:hypothetical protein